MASFQQIVTRACQAIGVADNSALTADDANLGLAVAEDLIQAMLGNGIGPRLEPVTQTVSTGVVNGRLYMCGLAPLTLSCPSNPKDGDRFGVVDATGELASHPVAIDPNGRILAGHANTVSVAQNGARRSYLFTAHSGRWNVIGGFKLRDEFPLAPEVQHGFVHLLAAALCPFYGQAVDPVAERARQGFERIARVYGQGGVFEPPIAL